MTKPTTVSVIVPVFNEQAVLNTVLTQLYKLKTSWRKEIIISDDGSTDGSGNIIAAWKNKHLFGWKFVKLPRNIGKGAAVAAGLKLATGDYVTIFDADGECDPRDLNLLVHKAINDHLFVVFGTRNTVDTAKKTIYWHYDLGVRFLALLINLLYSQHISDPEAGMKLMRRSIITFSITEKGFGQEIEWTAKLAKGIKIVELPIHYYPRTYAQGKKITVWDGFKAVWLVFKFRF